MVWSVQFIYRGYGSVPLLNGLQLLGLPLLCVPVAPVIPRHCWDLGLHHPCVGLPIALVLQGGKHMPPELMGPLGENQAGGEEGGSVGRGRGEAHRRLLAAWSILVLQYTGKVAIIH